MNAAHVTQHSAGRVREVSSCCILLVGRRTFFAIFLNSHRHHRELRAEMGYRERPIVFASGLTFRWTPERTNIATIVHSTPDTRLARANTHSDLGGVTLCHLLSRSFSVTWIGAARCCRIYHMEAYTSLFTFARAPKLRTVTFSKANSIVDSFTVYLKSNTRPCMLSADPIQITSLSHRQSIECPSKNLAN